MDNENSAPLETFVSEVGEVVSEGASFFFGKRFGKPIRLVFMGIKSLVKSAFPKPEQFAKSLSNVIERSNFNIKKLEIINNGTAIRFYEKDKAEQMMNTVNDFCKSEIQYWWITTQDLLVTEGNKIRQELVDSIQNKMQKISDELSSYLGKSLEIDLNINPIEFPKFEFSGIDAQIKKQQEIYQIKEKVTKYERKKECFKPERMIPYTAEEIQNKERTCYEVNLEEILHQINEKLDEQTESSKQLLERVINKQVSDDFKYAEKQVEDYINQFNQEFDNLLRDRETMEEKAPQIREQLKAEKQKLSQYQEQINAIQADLAIWQPKRSKVKID